MQPRAQPPKRSWLFSKSRIALHKILISCRYQSVPKPFYEQAYALINQAPVMPYSIMVLSALAQNMRNSQCNSVAPNELSHLIQSAYTNPSLNHKPLYKSVLYHIEAGLALLKNDIPHTRELLLQSYYIYPRRLDSLIQKAYIEMGQGMLTEAATTIQMVHDNATDARVSSQTVEQLDAAFKRSQL